MNSNQLSWNWVVRKWDGDQWPEKRISIGTDDGHAIFINAKYAGDVMEQANMAAAAPDMYNVLMAALKLDEDCEFEIPDDSSDRRFQEWLKTAKQALAKADGETS